MPEDAKRDIAAQFVANLLAQIELEVERIPTPAKLQDLINMAQDHNQAMLDAIEDIDPALRVQVEALIHDESQYDAWTGLVNELFEIAREITDG